MVRMFLSLHAGSSNMAALLRSARLLKFSPSGVLQISGTKRTGLPLSRLYSGAPGGRLGGACARQISPAWEQASSRLWPHAAAFVRRYVVATEQSDELSIGVQSKQAQHFDWALTKLDRSVRRTGRVTKTLLLRIFHDICREGYTSSNQVLLLLRSCGTLLPEVPMEERTQLAHHIWDKLQGLGVQYDVSHYNALLKVYLQNEFKFSPTDFLAKMEAANVLPNRVTYQRLIEAYCQQGDIEGASTILGFMKSNDLAITEAVFSSLVTGHARAGDLESAKNILPIMKGAGIEPGPDTYLSLLNVYAEKGDMEALNETLQVIERGDFSLMDRDIFQVILTLTRSGHKQFVPEMCERLRQDRGYIPDAMNLCLNLITLGHEDIAFSVLKTFPSMQPDTSSDSSNVGNFFLRHCVNIGTPVEKIISYCNALQESNCHREALNFSLLCALEAKNLDLSLQLMKEFKEQNLPIRPHYFWPLLTQHFNNNNTEGLLEVIKRMQEVGVKPDVETIFKFIQPSLGNLEEAERTLKDAGISMTDPQFLISKVRLMANADLAEIYNILSEPSFSEINLSTFRNSLITGFKKSNDVNSMVKITRLLNEDERFSRDISPNETVSYFLYNLILSMSEKELLSQADKLQSFFNQLQAEKITISLTIFRGIKKLLAANKVPELIKVVIPLVEQEAQNNTLESATSHAQQSTAPDIVSLERKLAEMKENKRPVSIIFKQAIQALSQDGNLERALELKQQYEDDMTTGCYAILIHLCCRHNNAEEAINLKRELSRKDSSATLSVNKSLALVEVLAVNDRLDEALDILKEMKEKEVMLKEINVVRVLNMLNSVAANTSSSSSSDVSTTQRLLDIILSLGLAKPSTSLCSPLITPHLERVLELIRAYYFRGYTLDSGNISAALDAALECEKRYDCVPRLHEILVALVEKGDTELLQKAMDFVSKKRGEMLMLYELFFAFLQTGRTREARKIIETPGLRAKPGCLQWYAEKCISSNQMEALEQMVDMTSKLFECDRDEMYCYLLRLCKETNDWQKAETVWTKMQEENIIPRERTLHLLADILKANNQDVPFEYPETWYKEAGAQGEAGGRKDARENKTDTSVQYWDQVIALCQKKKANEAYALLKEALQTGAGMNPTAVDRTLCTLLSKGSIEDALELIDMARSHMPTFSPSENATSLLIISYAKRDQARDALQQMKSMIQTNRVPSQLTFTNLVQALGRVGDVSGIEEAESLLKSLGTNLNLSKMLFINNTAMAHINNGDLDSAVEMLENVYTNEDGRNLSMSFVFRKVLEANDEKAIDKLSVMAERLANHFACYRPASDLFLNLLDQDKIQDAKFMLARCNAVAEQKNFLLSYVAMKAKTAGQVDKIKTLASLIPDFAPKDVLYAYLLKSHVMDKDFPAAKSLYEQAQKEGVVLDELSLKRLAGLYRDAGETLPFVEPEESFRFYANKLKQDSFKTSATAEK